MQIIACADSIVISAKSRNIKESLENLTEKQEINQNKTKYMKIGRMKSNIGDEVKVWVK